MAAGLGARPAAAQPPHSGTTVLVRVNAGASAAGRAQVSRALDAEAVRPLMAGWRAYRRDEPVTLAAARSLLDDVDAAGVVQLDAIMHPVAITNDPRVGNQWALPKISAPAGWTRAAGAAPVTVAVIDTGVDVSHPDLASRVWHNPGEIAGNGVDDDGNGLVDDVTGWDFFHGDASVYDSGDQNGDGEADDMHGTHVAGTIAAQRNNSVGVAGVADNARIMPLKFIGPDGGYTSDAVEAIHYAVSMGARVINASFGSTTYAPALCDAIAEAGAEGVVFVAAAGNDGTDNDASAFWPANCPATTLLSVAATTQSDSLASFSNRGRAQVDLGAPGQSVYSTLPGGAYGNLSGTSMAAPHVTGVAASVLGVRPDLAPWQVVTAIVDGGDPVASLAATTATGRRVNLDGALRAAATGVPDVTPPSAPASLAPADGLVTALTQPDFGWSPAADAQSGVAAYELRVDGGTVATVDAGSTSAIPDEALPEGRHTWDVVAWDGFGNESASAARALVVDRTPPGAPVPRTPAAGAGRTVGLVELTWRAATDGLSGLAGYRVEVDGAPAASVVPTVTAARVRLTAGRHSWRVVALDLAGNAAPGPARSIVVRPASRVTLSTPTIVRPGTRPVLRVRLTRTARVVFRVRPVTGTGASSRFIARLRSGPSAVRLPVAVARRLRPGTAYRVSAQPVGGTVRSTRISVTALSR
jgi:subtilisin family serine protease